jgi:hypothetical protein
MKKYQDERFTHLMNLSSRNMSVFFVLALPWSAVLMFLGSLTMEQGVVLVLGVWFAGLAINYLSLFYYYRQ